MNEASFPGLDEFFEKFCNAVKESGNERQFLAKWGLNTLDDAYAILKNNVQGGYDSHRQSMLSVPVHGSVLSIGPGMGFCLFLLSELYDAVFAAEPDGENCKILEGAVRFYQTDSGRKAGDIVTIYHAGIGISPQAVQYWQTKSRLMKQRKLAGSILNFDIQGAAELDETFPGRVDRIYLHKVLSSMSIASSFDRIVGQCARFLDEGGMLTWSEPGYIFDEFFQSDSHDGIAEAVRPIFAENGMRIDIDSYQVVNHDKESTLEETWTLLKAWRQTDEEG